MYLGKVFSVYFDKTCQTTWLFDKFHKSRTENAYDTLCLKNVCGIWTPKPGGTILEDISASVSFYVKDTCSYYYNTINARTTISDLKQEFCGSVFCANTESRDIIKSTISKAFEDNLFDKNGDFLFDIPIKFRAQNSYSRDSGFGRTQDFYIVGVNFNGDKLQKHLKEIEIQNPEKLIKNLALNQMKQLGFPQKSIDDFTHNNTVYLYTNEIIAVNNETEPALNSYLEKINGCVYAVVPEQQNDHLLLILYAYENNDNLIGKIYLKGQGLAYLVKADGWCRDGCRDGTIAGIMTDDTTVESLPYTQVMQLVKETNSL